MIRDVLMLTVPDPANLAFLEMYGLKSGSPGRGLLCNPVDRHSV
jgi:hypothetical protein